MTTADQRRHLLGSVRAENGAGTVRMEDLFDTTIEDLWSALTEPDRLSRWLAEVTGDLRTGGDFHARFTSGWAGPGRVEVCERPSRLLAVMSPGTAEETVIEARLVAEQGRTRLVVEERGLPLAEAVAYGAGWQAHVEDLAAHLTGREAGAWAERWSELAPRYRERGVGT